MPNAKNDKKDLCAQMDQSLWWHCIDRCWNFYRKDASIRILSKQKEV